MSPSPPTANFQPDQLLEQVWLFFDFPDKPGAATTGLLHASRTLGAKMDLIIWRHAEAADASQYAEDLARPLTAKGERQAHRMADWLHRHLPYPTRILASPATRTRQTAAALNRKFEICEALAPDCTVADLLQAADWPDSLLPVLIVGHQPSLGRLAATLLCGMEQPWSIKKGAIWWLRQRDRPTPSEAVFSVSLVTVRGPESQ